MVDRLSDVSFAYGPVLSWWRWAPCASWPARSADRYTGPWNATTKNPILVIGTRFDPNTPYADARRSAQRLGNAVLLTHDGYSHTSRNDPSACVKRATTAYLTRLRTPPPGTVCESDREPFDPKFGEPLPSMPAPISGSPDRRTAAVSHARQATQTPRNRRLAGDGRVGVILDTRGRAADRR